MSSTKSVRCQQPKYCTLTDWSFFPWSAHPGPGIRKESKEHMGFLIELKNSLDDNLGSIVSNESINQSFTSCETSPAPLLHLHRQHPCVPCTCHWALTPHSWRGKAIHAMHRYPCIMGLDESNDGARWLVIVILCIYILSILVDKFIHMLNLMPCTN